MNNAANEVQAVAQAAKARYKSVSAQQPGITKYEAWDSTVSYMVQARVAGWVGSNGEKSRSQKFDKLRDAQAWLSKQLTEMREEGPQALILRSPEKMTLAEVFAKYASMREADGTLSKDVRYCLNRIARHPLLANVKASQVNGKLAVDFCVSRRDGTQPLAPLAGSKHIRACKPCDPATISPEFVRAAMAMREVGKELGWKQYDPWNSDVRETLVDKGLIDDSDERSRRPTGEEMDAMMATLDTRMQDIATVAVINAFRRKEIAGLRWSDLDVAHSAIICWDRKDSSRKARLRNKDGKLQKRSSRNLVPLLPAALEVILRQPRAPHIQLGRPTVGVVPGSTEDLIFPVSGDHIGQLWNDARDIVAKSLPQIADLRFHDLRHEAISTFAPLMATSDAMQISGHKTERSFRRYINANPEDAKRISLKGANIRVKSAANKVVAMLRAA